MTNAVTMFSFFIDEIQCKIHAHKAKIDHIKHQNIVRVSAHDLTADSCDITKNDRTCENNAFPFCGTGCVALPHRDRPRNTKANEHQRFKNTYHNQNLLLIFLSFCLSDVIIHLTEVFVKYIIVMELITLRYKSKRGLYGTDQIALFLYRGKI